MFKDKSKLVGALLRWCDLLACDDGHRSLYGCHTVGVSHTAYHTACSRNWSVLPPEEKKKSRKGVLMGNLTVQHTNCKI